jgi:CheY-like chemotaxis protein
MRLKGATVLIVDDEPDLREIFSAWLQQAGCLVLTAANGVEALEVLAARKIDAMISDIRMPVMDGVALVRSIHESRLVIPIILVSGYVNAGPPDTRDLGVSAVMEKPLTRKDLLGVLENSLAKCKRLPRPVQPNADLKRTGKEAR